MQHRFKSSNRIMFKDKYRVYTRIAAELETTAGIIRFEVEHDLPLDSASPELMSKIKRNRFKAYKAWYDHNTHSSLRGIRHPYTVGPVRQKISKLKDLVNTRTYEMQ